MLFDFLFKKTFMDQIRDKAILNNKKSMKTVVFADADDDVLKACAIMLQKKIAKPLIVGNSAEIHQSLSRLKITNLKEEHIADYLSEKNKTQFTTFAEEYLAMRTKDGKQLTIEDATTKMKLSQYYGAMLVYKGIAEGMISGYTSKTKPYFPAFEIIKTKEGVSRTSGVMIMSNKDKMLLFADCALNITPTQEQLAEIALLTSEMSIELGIKPKIAMLSFSTRNTAKHESIDKMTNATAIVKQKNPGIIIDGEIQVDAALEPIVMKRKCPDSKLEGDANVLIFPDLNAGNIGYKLVERLGKFKAVGPVMQGLNKPLNDLSRGCSVEDIVDLAAITVLQAQ